MWLIDRDFPSGVAKLGHTGARALVTGGCAPPCSASAPENYRCRMSLIANWALKVHKGVEVELRSKLTAICILRITWSRMFP